MDASAFGQNPHPCHAETCLPPDWSCTTRAEMHLLLVFSLLICIVSSTDTQRHTLPTYLTPTPSDTRCCLLTHTTCCAHTIRTVPTHLSPASSDMHGCFLTRSCYADNVSWECDDSAGYGTLGQDKQYCRCLRCSPCHPGMIDPHICTTAA